MALLAAGRYVADASLATALFLALKLRRPLLLEGEAGVGKTEVAKVLAEALGRRLIRLQCYEGLDAAAALYEWNYSRQMLEIRLAELAGQGRDAVADTIFSEPFLLKRPLLQALEQGGVLLIDELDRTDEPFEAFLLEILSDFQVTIPELGTVRAAEPPIVVLTSTAPARSTTRSSGAASTTGSAIRTRRASWRSCAPARPRCRSSCRQQIVASCRSCARPTCSSCPAWPRRSTGPARWSPSTRSRSIPSRRERDARRAAQVPGRRRDGGRRPGRRAARRDRLTWPRSLT